MVLGLRIASATSPHVKPPVSQVIIRNAVKILELYFLPLLFIVFITQRRQRLGDLLARTIVVQPTAARETRSDNDQQY